MFNFMFNFLLLICSACVLGSSVFFDDAYFAFTFFTIGTLGMGASIILMERKQ